MKLIIYRPANADITTFVEFWADRYQGYDEAFYQNNIGKELTQDRILEWFTWKNGTPLSEAKRQSVMRNFVARRGELDHVKSKETASDLLDRFNSGGAIWRIFWLHCWQPVRFPIYDQHVHRAMRFIQSGVQEEIPERESEKIRTYLDSYIAFHSQFDGINYRLVDRALWAFGKFISENNLPTEVTP